MTEQIHILYIDDNPMDRALVRHSLEKEHRGFILTEASSKKEFEKLIHEQTFDLVLTDFNILGFEGLQVLATVQSVSPDTPVIIVTGTGSEEVAVEAMKQGAGDYVIKTTSHITRLPKTILSVLETKRIRGEKEKAQIELAKMNRVYAVISQINQLIVRTSDREKLFCESCDIAIEFGKFRMAWIGLVDEENKIVKPFCWSGHEDGYLTNIKTIRIDDSPESKSPTGTAVRTGKYSLCNAIAEDPMIAPWRSEALQRSYHSSIALPVKLNDKVIGTFNLYSDEPNFFNEQEIVLLEEVVDDISFALTSLHTEAEHQMAENTILQERTLLRTLIDNLPNGIFVKDKEYRKIIANPIHTEEVLGHLKYLGLNADIDIINKTDFEVFPKELAEKYFSDDQNVIRDGHSIINNVEFGIQPDGKKIWFLTSKVPLCDKDGSITGMIGITNDITERKQAEEALRKSQEQFRIAQDMSPDGFTILRPVRDAQERVVDFTWIYENAAVARLNGTDPEAVVGRRLLELFPGHRGTPFLRAYQQVAESGESCIFESDYSGESITKPTSFRVVVVPMAGDIAILAQDITERKQAETNIRESEKKYRLLFEQMINGFALHEIICDADGKPVDYRFLEINKTFGTMTDLDPINIIGKTCLEVLPDTESFWIKKYGEVALTGKSIRFEHFSGALKKYYEVTAYCPKPGQFAVTFNDITKRKQAEQKLIESEYKYRNLVENINDIIYSTDDKGIFTYISSAIEILSGWRPDELIGKAFIDFIYPDDRPRILSLFQKVASGQIEPSEYRILTKSDGIRWIRTSSRPVIKNGRFSGLQGVMTDITERKQMEAEKLELEDKFRESQKMESIGTLAGGIAHDFNNLLTVIQGHAQMAMLAMNESNPQYKDLTQIMNSSTRAASLTRQLLMFSRKQTVELKTLDLNQTIRNLLKMIQRLIGENIKVNTNMASDLPNVQADEGNIEQVIMNLAVNARDAMPDGGKLTIKTENILITDDDQKYMPESRIGSFVRISVQDSGIGIPKEILSKIFEPFYSTKEKGKGTGLGLSVVYGIVKSHGGWINVYSEPEQGTVFKIYLPASVSAFSEESATQAESKESLYGNGEKILVIEDEQGILDLASTALRQYGYVIQVASNGQEAKSVFEESKGNFQLIISDVILPDINGFDLVTKLIVNNPSIPVVMCSGYTEERVKQSIIQDKGFRFLQKPYSVSALLEMVSNTIQKS